MATSQTIQVFGCPPDWKPPTKKEFHGDTYLEYEVPNKIKKELSRLIEKRLKQFYKECQCDRCKEDRKPKNKQ